jgi:hypothetical protein
LEDCLKGGWSTNSDDIRFAGLPRKLIGLIGLIGRIGLIKAVERLYLVFSAAVPLPKHSIICLLGCTRHGRSTAGFEKY